MLILASLFTALADDDPVLNATSQEIERVWPILTQEEESPHWLGIGVNDVIEYRVQATHGSKMSPDISHMRTADIDIRVGTPELDSTHPLRDSGWFNEDTHFEIELPIEDDPLAIQSALWLGIDTAYRSGVRRIIKIRTNNTVKVEIEDQSGDWSVSPVTEHIEELTPLAIDILDWQNKLQSVSSAALGYPEVYDSFAALDAKREIRYFVDSDGNRIRQQFIRFRVSVFAETIAEDGMELKSYDYIDAHSLDNLPSVETITQMMHSTAQKVTDLRNAPVVDPYVGPAILRGRAAAVFFHEILGHRAEGHRQKDDTEGQTLTDKVNEVIFPDFITVVDDPTLQNWNGLDLNGYYRVDDEGVNAQKVIVVEDGVLRNFLMSRSPIEGFDQSNGHGRRDLGYAPVSRQGNLIVSSDTTMPYQSLKTALLKEIRQQGKPFGLIFDDISGGFTFTGRTTPNSYNVQPVTVWKVYPDGREELVRGVDMIGTPLLTFSRIKAASETQQVFNGSCGAESGWVPVSAIAPDLLVSEVEVQRRDKGTNRPPLLSPPTAGERQ
ncbi:MAG: metallopeptidase TldD-related protein [Myxococcota bacterium]|nr:metallopeptidase TldD-related protein [Myxococcota bacterium]